MATTAYLWEARAKNGDVKKGVMEADSEEAIHNKLKLQLLSPIEVKKQPKQITIRLGSGVKTEDMVIFTRLFATMIDAGLAMVQSLQALGEQTSNKVMRDVIKDITQRVESGDSFS